VQKYGKAGQATDNNIIRCMRSAFRANKATDTHSEYIIRIAFLRQKRISEGACVLRYTCIACFVLHMVIQVCASGSDYTRNLQPY
jgi:hypothetical protein